MDYIYDKPYVLFLAFIATLLAFGFYKGNDLLDINIHDTYFVISWKHLMILISLIYGLLSLIYFILLKLNFSLVNWMTISHVLVSTIGLIAVFTLSKLMRENVPGDITFYIDNIKFNQRIAYTILISIITILGTQILFLINAVYALIKGRV